MMYTNQLKRGGFSLIELLVYMMISSILLILIITLYFSLAQARVRQQSEAEVETQGVLVMNILTRTIRNAHDIISPVSGASASSLSINPYATSTKPVVVDLNGSTIRMTEAGGTPTALTNSQIVVSNVTFQNAGLGGTLGSIKITFTLSHATTTKYSSQYTKTFYGSATLRRIAQ